MTNEEIRAHNNKHCPAEFARGVLSGIKADLSLKDFISERDLVLFDLIYNAMLTNMSNGYCWCDICEKQFPKYRADFYKALDLINKDKNGL